MTEETPADPSCASCTFFRAPGPHAAKAIAAGIGAGHGTCQRFPEAVRKLPTEVCGEHPDFAVFHDKRLAGLIADQIARVASDVQVDRRVAAELAVAAPGADARPVKPKTLFRR